jgi:hypothetical protein
MGRTSKRTLTTLERIRSGDIQVQCPVTLMKATESVLHRWMAKQPMVLSWAAFFR